MPAPSLRRAVRAATLAALILAALPAAIPAPARAQDYSAVLAAPDRSAADRQNDKRRDALQLLSFTGPKTGWKVLDLGAGAGYSTELMARSVGPTGHVWGQNPNPSAKLEARLKTPAMKNASEQVQPYETLAAGLPPLDLITFFFAYHDTTFMGVDRAKMDRAMFDALKPGGYLVVADHAALPQDGATVGKKYHRIAEATLKSEVEAVGFKLVGEGNFLRHPDDPHNVIVFRMPGKVDEFVLKFQKPM